MSAARPLGYWLKLVDHLLEERIDEVLSTHGFSRRLWQSLSLLSQREVTGNAAFAAGMAPFLGPGAPTMFALIGDLADRDLAVQVEGGTRLTEKGVARFQELSAKIAEFRGVASRGLDDGAYERLLDDLQTVARNLGWQGEPPDAP